MHLGNLQQLAALLLLLATAVLLPPAQSQAQAPARPDAGPPQIPPGLPPLSLPIRCSPGKDCAVQFYPDADPSADIRDYRCGRTTYDRHRGTDIRVPSMADIRRGVEVLAAAAGRVAAIRDGEPDIDVNVRGRDEVVASGKAGGNLVVLRHDPGWTSLYWHMRKDSVRVRQGQDVAAGDVLGLVGLSGDTNFPHLHFELRYRNRHVDPFTGIEPSVAGRCGVAAQSLWSQEAATQLGWREITLLQSGFADRVPDRRAAEEQAPPSELPARAAVLAFWWELVGVEIGDRTEAAIVGPGGRTVAERSRSYDRARGFVFDHLTRRNSEQVLPPGTYTGRLRHRRGDRLILDTTTSIELR